MIQYRIKRRTNGGPTPRGIFATLVVALVGTLALSASASAYSGDFKAFNDCPVKATGIAYCLNSVTTSGKVVLGKQTTPIVNPVTLQGGYSFNSETEAEAFIGAADGNTLSKTPQPVPGGLLGLVNCSEISNLIERISCELVFQNKVTGVNATLELAKPATSIGINAADLINEEGVALQLPVKVHLENPFLGSECYVGSAASPLIWNLTTGATHPPGPNKSIHGTSGTAGLLDEAIATLTGASLVDNAFSAPGASGCGGIFAFLIDPIINGKLGLPAAAGNNTVILNNNVKQAYFESVLEHP